MSGQYRHEQKIFINKSLKSYHKRSLGCVLFELLCLQIAFPDGPKDDGRVEKILQSSELDVFKNILSK